MRQSFSYEIGSIVVHFYAFFCKTDALNHKKQNLWFYRQIEQFTKRNCQKTIWNLILKTDVMEIGNSKYISDFLFHIIAMGRQLCLQLIR